MGLVLTWSWDIARVTQPDLGSGTSFTDKDSDHYILQSLMKIDAVVEVKMLQLKGKKIRATQREKSFYMLKKKVGKVSFGT